MKILAALLILAAPVIAEARVVDVVADPSGAYVMLTDEHASNGMPLFRVFGSDGSMWASGGYVPTFNGYAAVELPRLVRYHLPRGNAVARRQLHDVLDLRCRGDSGDDPKTQRACQLRDQLEQ